MRKVAGNRRDHKTYTRVTAGFVLERLVINNSLHIYTQRPVTASFREGGWELSPRPSGTQFEKPKWSALKLFLGM